MKELFTKQFWLSEGETSTQFKKTSEKIERWDLVVAIVGLASAAYCMWFFTTHEAAVIKAIQNLKISL